MTIALTPMAAIDAAIHANLAALVCRLETARQLAVEAPSAMGAGRRSEAIGTILPVEQIVPECDALARTILLLHRAPRFDELEGGAP